VSRFVRVTSFAPDIQGTVLEGRQPEGMEGIQPEELARAVRGMLGMRKFDIAELPMS
jgi:hypothetical protein